MSAKVYEIVTEKILESLEKGCIPWRKPWKSTGGSGSFSTGFIPVNHKTGKGYRGINVWLLNATFLGLGYTSNRWLSFKQCEAMGGTVKDAEKKNSQLVVFWKFFLVEEVHPVTGKKEKKKIPMLRYYRVYNVEQCDGLKLPKLVPEPVKPEAPAPAPLGVIEAAEAIITGWEGAPTMKHNGGNRAFYRPATDTIHLPDREAFHSPAGYYETMFHEMGHATGHQSRLKRAGIVNHEGFGSHSYGREELVAEMCSAFLCGVSGIEMEVLDNTTAYIGHWMKAIKEDARAVVMAAAQAQKAADCILNIKHETEATEDNEKTEERKAA